MRYSIFPSSCVMETIELLGPHALPLFDHSPLLSMAAVDGVIWEVLDERGGIDAVAALEDFRRVVERQAPVRAANGMPVGAVRAG